MVRRDCGRGVASALHLGKSLRSLCITYGLVGYGDVSVSTRPDVSASRARIAMTAPADALETTAATPARPGPLPDVDPEPTGAGARILIAVFVAMPMPSLNGDIPL